LLKDEILELHKAGFVYRDLRRPSDMPGERFGHIFLTPQGFRLINVGISAPRSKVGDRLFDRFQEHEITELAEFEKWVLER
jgi:hypothetical protein